MINNADKPSVGAGLLLAGFIPQFSWFDSSHLSTLYFALLIPPTAFHCYTWFKKSILPSVIDGLIHLTVLSRSEHSELPAGPQSVVLQVSSPDNSVQLEVDSPDSSSKSSQSPSVPQ